MTSLSLQLLISLISPFLHSKVRFSNNTCMGKMWLFNYEAGLVRIEKRKKKYPSRVEKRFLSNARRTA